MKLAYIATTALIALVGAGVYLVVQNENEGKLQEIQANNDRKLQQLENKFNEQAKDAAEVQRRLKEAAEVAAAGKLPVIARATGAASKEPGVTDALDEVKKNLRNK